MTEKLYEADALLRSCQAKVLSCTKAEGHFEIVLDRTVIFPEGGGQLSDRGKIDNADVSYAKELQGEVVHYTNLPLAEGSTVTVTLDWEVRLDRMQQHTGEHILSYACWKLFEANNVGFHMNEDLVTIDLDKELTAAELEQVELYANNEVWLDKPITVQYLPHTEVAKLVMRKKNEKLTGLLRVVAVEQGDICTCCGTHPPRTGLVGAIKIFRVEKHKGGLRLEFGCGKRALLDAEKRYQAINTTAQSLSVKVEQVPEALASLQEELSSMRSELQSKTLELVRMRLAPQLAQKQETPEGWQVICVKEAMDALTAKSLMQELSAEPHRRIAIFAQQGARVNYQFAISAGATGDCRAYISKANELLQGKGGGKLDFAQGGAPLRAGWEQAALEVEKIMLEGENNG